MLGWHLKDFRSQEKERRHRTVWVERAVGIESLAAEQDDIDAELDKPLLDQAVFVMMLAVLKSQSEEKENIIREILQGYIASNVEETYARLEQEEEMTARGFRMRLMRFLNQVLTLVYEVFGRTYDHLSHGKKEHARNMLKEILEGNKALKDLLQGGESGTKDDFLGVLLLLFMPFFP